MASARGPASGDQAGEGADTQQHHGDSRDRHGVGRLNPEQQAANRPA